MDLDAQKQQRWGLLTLNVSPDVAIAALTLEATGPGNTQIVHVSSVDQLKDIDVLAIWGEDVDFMSSEAMRRGLLGPLRAFTWSNGCIRGFGDAALQFMKRHSFTCTMDQGTPPKSILQFEALVRSDPRAVASPSDRRPQRVFADACGLEEAWCRSVYQPDDPRSGLPEHFLLKTSHLGRTRSSISLIQVLWLYPDPEAAKAAFDTKDLLEVRGGEGGAMPAFLKELSLQQLLQRCSEGAEADADADPLAWLAAHKLPLLQAHRARASAFSADSRASRRLRGSDQRSTLATVETSAVLALRCGGFLLKTYVSGVDAGVAATMCITATSTWLQRILSFQQAGTDMTKEEAQGTWHPSFAACMARLFAELRCESGEGGTSWVRRKEEPGSAGVALDVAKQFEGFAVQPECACCGSFDEARRAGPGGGGKRNQLCSKCKGVRYCSRACQQQHWAAHKPLCTPA